MLHACWTAVFCIACAGTPEVVDLGRSSAPEAPEPVATDAEPVLEPAPALEFDQTHAAWTVLLSNHVQEDRVDYAGLLQERDQLDAYLRSLVAVTPEELAAWEKDERFAYWINVYNGFCIRLVLDHYPVESIRDIGGKLMGRVWDREFIPMTRHHPAGDDDPLSLNDLEHEIIRVQFEDARLHAAINCASFSCPPLRAEAFTAQELDKQLEEQMRSFLADTQRNRFDRAKGKAEVSEIFNWFKSDFERDAGSVEAYLAKFGPGPEPSWIQTADIDHLDYGWQLNDVK